MAEAAFLRLAVIGDPVAHSRSPALHRGFLASAGRRGSYDALRFAAGDGRRALEELRALGYAGLNVTTPLKEEAFARADWRDAAASASGSVNTVVLGPQIRGYDTDGIGALGVLRDAGLGDSAGARILVLGAGPTARAAIVALASAGASVSLWNRSADRARAVARALGVRPYAPGERFDAVFAALAPNATLADVALEASVQDAPLFVDANYGERATLARALGRPGHDGTRMLEHSARASFDLFVAAQTATVIE
jgi:shikimate dehydrogenase